MPASPSAVADAAAAAAAAKAINLVASDLPAGWTGAANDNSGSTSEDAQLAACAGAPDPTASDVADISSDDFSNQGDDVTSDVVLVKTLQLARQDLAAMQSQRALTCLRQLYPTFAKASAPPGAQITVVSVDRIPVASYGDGSFGFRVVFDMSAGQMTIRGTGDQIGFLKGRLEVSATFGGLDSVFPADLEQSLMGTLASRANRSPVP